MTELKKAALVAQIAQCQRELREANVAHEERKWAHYRELEALEEDRGLTDEERSRRKGDDAYYAEKRCLELRAEADTALERAEELTQQLKEIVLEEQTCVT